MISKKYEKKYKELDLLKKKYSDLYNKLSKKIIKTDNLYDILTELAEYYSHNKFDRELENYNKIYGRYTKYKEEVKPVINRYREKLIELILYYYKMYITKLHREFKRSKDPQIFIDFLYLTDLANLFS